MIIYLETREVFLGHVRRNRIEEVVGERLKAIAGRRVSPAEVRAWRNSFQYVSQFLLDPMIPAALGVAIEYQIHNTARRIDLLLSGRSPDDRNAAVIVELKQWETVDATAMDGVVRSVVGGGPRELTHPSYQAWSYSCLLEDFNTAVQEHSIAINPCAYLHNCSDGSGVLADCYQDYLERAPVFLRHHTDELVGFLTRCLQQGDGGETIKRIRDGRARPSRQLAEVFEQMVLGNSEFTLIEEQKVVYERALQFARKLRPGKRMALWDGNGARAVLRDNPVVREQVISECVELHSQLPVANARELGSFIYDGLILQLRSMGPGLLVDRWIRQHCPDLQEAQEQAIASEITNNLGALKPSIRANYPGTVYEASISMNAAYARFGGDLLGKPYLAVPYLSQGYGEKARCLIALALEGGSPAEEPTDRQIIDSWARELGISGWYDWTEQDEQV